MLTKTTTMIITLFFFYFFGDDDEDDDDYKDFFIVVVMLRGYCCKVSFIILLLVNIFFSTFIVYLFVYICFCCIFKRFLLYTLRLGRLNENHTHKHLKNFKYKLEDCFFFCRSDMSITRKTRIFFHVFWAVENKLKFVK